MAPAITLNRMYHCVPSSSSTIDPSPRPPPIRMSTSSTMGNSAVAGTEAAICASGCAMRASLGLKPMATPAGIVHAAPMTSAAITRRKVAPAPVSSSRYSSPFSPVSIAMALRDGVEHREHGNRRRWRDRSRLSRSWRSVFSRGVMKPGEVQRQPLAQGLNRTSCAAGRSPREPCHDIEKPRARRVGALHLLHLELLGPGDDRPPHNLVEQHDDRDHGSDAPQDRFGVAGAGRGLQIRTQSRQTKVARSPARTSRRPSGRTSRPRPTSWSSTRGRSQRKAIQIA